jgi:hypothetical protein
VTIFGKPSESLQAKSRLNFDTLRRPINLIGVFMKKISLIVLPISLLIGATSFAETYAGHGDQTEYGEETCGMIVEPTGETLVIKILAIDQEITAVVADGDDVNFKVEMQSDAKFTVEGKKQTGKLKIKVSGQLKDSKPVSYKLETEASDSVTGQDNETINCKF